jgi:putative tryptophan/tyrosine transport system substrate-binding protein
MFIQLMKWRALIARGSAAAGARRRGRRMRRRDFTAGLLLSPIARSALAQQPARQYRIALVHPTIPANQLTEMGGAFYHLFFVELHRSGYTEGGNLTIERYSAEGHPDRFAELAREVVNRNPDLIAVIGNEFATAFNAATRMIPILAIMIDPIKTGTVASLAHPGGNITGISLDAGFDIYGKRLQILKELLPPASRVGFLAVRDEWDSPGGLALRDTARDLGITLIDISLLDVDPSAIRRAFAEMPQQRLDGLLVGQILYRYRELIPQLTEQVRLPAIYPYREFVQAGGLIAYAPDFTDLARRFAQQMREILNGAKPGDIPIYQPAKLELVINLETAKALGLAIPPTLLARADEVIE